MVITFESLKSSDINDLIGPMTRAFDADAKAFQGKERGGPPGYDDGSFLRKWGLDNVDSYAYKIIVDNKPIGAFVLWWDKDGVSTLGNIFVDPDYQNNGVGALAWKFIEKTFPTQKWQLETPIWALRNHHFYENRCGFKQVGSRDDQLLFEKSLP